jgi:DNA mismatch repair protein MutL
MKSLRIHQLSPLVANQIAAGEVIERPASIVKELLENALDSCADTISIDIGFGGLNQIKVCDNGEGIVSDDLPLAITAHATSKISQLNDLYAISTLGFRGEALASIAAVSRLSISSKTAEQSHAMKLRCDGDKPSLTPCARSQGTTVEVIDLFYNTPVRKKFLKTPRSEYLAIEMVVKRFALSAPSIALNLNHDGKQILTLPSATCDKTKLLRIKKLLGKEFVDHAIFLDIEQAGMRLYGWVSASTYDRSQNDKQWVYINQRMVKDKLMNHAIKQAYDGLLHPGRYPACVLYFTLPAADVDVNVHPTKHEVRFQQPRLVHDFIITHLSKALTLSKEEIKLPSKTLDTSHQVREEYVSQPLLAMKFPEAHSTHVWHTLNSQYALISLQGCPYLIDIKRVHHDRLMSLINQQERPLAHRPLLVPISYKLINADKKLWLTQLKPLLVNFGVQWDWCFETTLMVKTIPQLLPQLDIKPLFQSLEKNNDVSSPSLLLKVLLKHQAIDVLQFQPDDKIVIINYLEEQYALSDSAIPGGLRLDNNKCQEILHA